MNVLLTAALEAQKFFRKKRWKFCVIGGLAVLRWGQPRATQDVDFSLLAGLGKEERYVDSLLARFTGRISDVRDFALRSRVLLCQATNGVSLDIALAAFPFEEKVIERASAFRFAPGASLVTASAEDLVVLKAFAARDQDWADVKGIIERQGDRLDWGQIVPELTELSELKEDQSDLERLNQIREQARRDLE